jgi:dienelactone hydrolase
MVNEFAGRRWVAALLVGVIVVAGCSSGDDSDSSPGSSGSSGSSSDSDGPAEASAPAAEAPFPVGRRTVTLVDDSRPTDAVPAAGIAASGSRTIEVELVYPAAEGSTGADSPAEGSDGAGIDAVEAPGSVEDAPPAEGPFPLVVWAHGFNSRGDVFRPYGERWAREGYVVALPTFPLSREGIGFSDDVQNQPGDVSFVIDEMLGLPGDDPLAGVADPDHVAVGGHSLGSATTFGVAYNSCCVDDRIDAAISVSGGGLPYEGGDYETMPDTPLLLMHGARDPLVPVAAGDATFENQPGPVTYVRFTEADHNNLFWGEDGELLDTASLAFLDASLRDAPAALESLPAEVDASGRATFDSK